MSLRTRWVFSHNLNKASDSYALHSLTWKFEELMSWSCKCHHVNHFLPCHAAQIERPETNKEVQIPIPYAVLTELFVKALDQLNIDLETV